MNKCFSHKEIDAIFFCQECRIYICNKCEKLHSELFKNHHQFKLDKDFSDIFTGLCKEISHNDELKYFCKVHNKLCCAKCITKIKTKEIGQHKDCDVCIIEDIENEKKDKLKQNIKTLEELSINLQQTINKLKIFFDKTEKNKEEIKLNVHKIFTL